jgi:hypothetical protein
MDSNGIKCVVIYSEELNEKKTPQAMHFFGWYIDLHSPLRQPSPPTTIIVHPVFFSEKARGSSSINVIRSIILPVSLFCSAPTSQEQRNMTNDYEAFLFQT